MKILTVIQARLGSSRLPGKILLPLGERTILEEMVFRVRAARFVETVVVATTTESQDQPVVEICERAEIPYVRGHPTDCLDRHRAALDAFPAAAVAKIPSDCPLIDPRAIDRVYGFWQGHRGEYDFVSNLHPGSWPDGNDVEIMSAEALRTACREAVRPLEREHTTPFFWENPDRFRVGNVLWETGLDLSTAFRWTLDYPEDYALIRTVFEANRRKEPGDGLPFGVDEILDFLEAHPEARALNQKFVGDSWMVKHSQELRTFSEKQK